VVWQGQWDWKRENQERDNLKIKFNNLCHLHKKLMEMHTYLLFMEILYIDCAAKNSDKMPL
jgi:hypothetical protein